MNIMITSTEKLTHIDGVPVRIWEGVTERGTKCIVAIHRIIVDKKENQSELEDELKDKLPPGVVYPLHKIL